MWIFFAKSMLRPGSMKLFCEEDAFLFCRSDFKFAPLLLVARF